MVASDGCNGAANGDHCVSSVSPQPPNGQHADPNRARDLQVHLDRDGHRHCGFKHSETAFQLVAPSPVVASIDGAACPDPLRAPASVLQELVVCVVAPAAPPWWALLVRLPTGSQPERSCGIPRFCRAGSGLARVRRLSLWAGEAGDRLQAVIKKNREENLALAQFTLRLLAINMIAFQQLASPMRMKPTEALRFSWVLVFLFREPLKTLNFER